MLALVDFTGPLSLSLSPLSLCLSLSLSLFDNLSLPRLGPRLLSNCELMSSRYQKISKLPKMELNECPEYFVGKLSYL